MTLERLLVETVKKVGNTLRENAFLVNNIEWKSSDDPVTELDKQTERAIKELVLQEMAANFIGEEYGLEDNNAEHTWIIDPIDGTKSFLRGEFYSSVSVAVERKGRLIAGCIYDFMKDIMYVATENGFYLLHNGKKVSLNKDYKSTRIRITYDGKIPNHSYFAEDKDISFIKRCGSIALKIAHLASGAYDALILNPGKSNSWDIAAGYFLLKQGNFYVSDIYGEPFDYRNPSKGLIAIKKEIAPKILEKLLGRKKTIAPTLAH